MKWLTLLSSFIALARLVFAEAAKRQQREVLENGMEMGRTAALKEVLDEALNLLSQADLARRMFRDHLRFHPDSLSDDDGFKRNTSRSRPTGATDDR